ncbi:tetratricopeptide repeat protein [Streptomyces acidiscabies]
MTGMGGVGKTSLVVEAAHQAMEKHLPGGSLLVDLQGDDRSPVTADQAVRALLDALGVRADDLPGTPVRRHELYQRTLAARREPTLLILDNANAPSQYLPLLPSHPGATHHPVVVTSRDRPDSLALDVVALAQLRPEESARLITQVLADERPSTEPAALAELADLCGHLPLALQIAAAALRRRSPRGIASLVADIVGAEDPTAAMDAGSLGTDEAGRPLRIRPVLAASYGQLPEELARLLRLLARAPGPDIGTPAVAVLADLDLGTAYGRLEKLAGAHLVVAHPGSGANEVRWRLHDLMRAYATGLTRRDTRLAAECDAARERLLDHYCRTAETAANWLRWTPGTPPPNLFAGRDKALAWLNEERRGLLAAAGWAGEKRFERAALRLGECLWLYLDWRRYYDDLITVGTAAKDAAHRAGDPANEAAAVNNLGLALRGASDLDGAIEVHTLARDMYRMVDDRHGEAKACGNLGNSLRRAGRTTEAVRSLTEARDLFRAVGEVRGEAVACGNLGNALYEAGLPVQAIRAQTQARDLFRSVADIHGEATACGNLGLALQMARRYPRALDAYDHARSLSAAVGDARGEATAWLNIGKTFTQARMPEESLEPYGQAASIFESLGAWRMAAEAHQRAADAHELLDDQAASLSSVKEAARCRSRLDGPAPG